MLFCQRNSGHEEHQEVLVLVIEVASVKLVEVVPELTLGIVVRGHTARQIGDAEGVAVKHHAQDTAGRDHFIARSVDIDGRNLIKAKGLTRTLPIGNSFRIGESGVGIVERGGLEVEVSRVAEIGQHHNVKHILGSEPVTTADVEQTGDSG